MKKTLLILSAIFLFFAGCKKDDVIEASKVEVKNEMIEEGSNYIKINAAYVYPEEMAAVSLYLSEQENMSDAKVYECKMEGKSFSVEANGLKENKKYHYCYEFDNGYEKKTVYGEQRSFTTLQNIELPTVTTTNVSNITQTTATSGGNVTSDGGANVTARGVCWSTSQNPTISNSHTTDGNGIGRFTSNITGLTANTTYYIRAYATNEKGTSYGEEKSFTTMVNESMPVVTTNEITDITQTTATSGGNVTSDGGVNVTARGVCWSTSQNPTISNSHTTDGNGTGSFTSSITGLTANTTYYVRAYATNEKGTSYGEEKSFKTMVSESMPVVTTNEITGITQTTATSGGNVTSDGGVNVTARGVCWSTSQNPTISNSHTTDGNGTGSFTSSITGLTANTTYYVRAYATNEKGTSYGEQRSFTTLDPPTINGHEYVDLGLPSGLKWATCNVGANSPADYGDYFAWGETETKTEYTQGNSLTNGLSISELQSQGYIDGSGNLTPSHDAATANWGGSWRMPTEAELEELIVECTWTWTTQDVYKVTGPNGNHIILPAPGSCLGSSPNGWDMSGFYWSSMPYESNSGNAYCLRFDSSGQNVNGIARHYGNSVRPVSE